MQQPRVYIIILNYNNPKDTIECLESIYHKLIYDNFHVILLDNSSTDDSECIFKNWQQENKPFNFTFIQTGANKGFAGGNNIGILFAQKQGDMDYVWILNNDTVVVKDTLLELVKKMESNKNIGLCGSLLYYYNSSRIQAISGIYNPWFATSTYNTNIYNIPKWSYPVGASMMASDDFIKRVGLLSEDYFLYYEEMDWVMRARRLFLISYAPKSIVYHKEGATIGSNADPMKKSTLSDYYALKNRLVFSKKYFMRYTPIVYLGLIISLINRVRRKQWARAKMITSIIFTGK